MKEFTRKVLIAAAPVFGTCISIAVLQAADLPFPLVLSLDAWPEWVVFMSLVHTCTALCMFIPNRILGEAQSRDPRMSLPAA